MGAATPHSVFGSAASLFRIPFRVLRRSSAGKDDELEQGAAGVWAGDGGLDRLATPPRAGRVLASSTAKGIPGARLDWSAGCAPRPLLPPQPALPGASGRLVVPHSRFPVRPSARPFARPFVCPSQVWAEALFSPRDRAIALQPTPTWVFGDSNPPQKPAAGCSPCCTCAHLETQPLHRWRRWRWGYPSSDTLLPFGPPATAEWSSVDLPTWRRRLWLFGLVPCGRSIPLE